MTRETRRIVRGALLALTLCAASCTRPVSSAVTHESGHVEEVPALDALLVQLVRSGPASEILEVQYGEHHVRTKGATWWPLDSGRPGAGTPVPLTVVIVDVLLERGDRVWARGSLIDDERFLSWRFHSSRRANGTLECSLYYEEDNWDDLAQSGLLCF